MVLLSDAGGKRKRLRGARHGNRRPDLVICDDLEDDENIDSPEQREKDRKWFFKAVMKIGGRYTVYIVIGTLLHYDSLLARLLNRPGWQGKNGRRSFAGLLLNFGKSGKRFLHLVRKTLK